MAAGGGDLQSALGVLLALNVLEVRARRAVGHGTGLGGAQGLRAAKVIDQGDQRAGGENRRFAGPGRLGPASLRADEPKTQGARSHGRRQGAGHCGDLAIEVKLTDGGPTVQGILRDNSHGRHQGEGDGQVEMIAFLGQVRRGEVDHHPAHWERETQS